MNTFWVSEDNGYDRLQIVFPNYKSLNITNKSKIQIVKKRLFFGQMIIVANFNELYLLKSQIIRNHIFKLPNKIKIEKLCPITLRTLKSTSWLKAGKFWPGGITVHFNEKIYVISGRWCYCLDSLCNVLISIKLPLQEAYNGFIITSNGVLITKQISDKYNAEILLIDPNNLNIIYRTIALEPSVARLSFKNNFLYVVGIYSIFRYKFIPDQNKLDLDLSWCFCYTSKKEQSYAWDCIITENDVWFMDNGKHNYLYSLRNRGKNKLANRIIRVSIENSNNYLIEYISSKKYGTVTNPPLYDTDRNILIAYDAGNAIIKAYRYYKEHNKLKEIWSKENFGVSSHFIFYQQSGELCTNDYKSLWQGDSSVILDIETGEEKARIPLNNYMQGVVFPAAGCSQNYYYLTFDMIVNISILNNHQ